MSEIGEVPCATCGGTRQVVTRGPISEVDGEEVWIKVDLEPCPDCGNAESRPEAALATQPPEAPGGIDPSLPDDAA